MKRVQRKINTNQVIFCATQDKYTLDLRGKDWMTQDRKNNDLELRKRAEDLLKSRPSANVSERSTLEMQRLLHELQVHQIEMEMQNEELRESRERLETIASRFMHLYDFAPVGYMSVSETSLILEANLTVATLLGVPRAMLFGQLLTSFVLADDQDVYRHYCAQLFASGEPHTCELRLITAKEVPLWVRLKSSISKVGGDGQPVNRVVISDISERKQAEEERLNLQAQLLQASKMESIGRLAGGVAHDFNNMLTVILGQAVVALMDMDESQPHFAGLQEIRTAAERSAVLTRQLMAFARKQVVEPKVIDLNQTVNSMLSLLQRLIGEDITLTWLPGTDLWPIKMDPSQIDQIMANLCVNARDVLGGTGTLTIETHTSTLDSEFCAAHPGSVAGDYVELVISDNGCGMDNETLDNIFEPFFTTKEPGKVTGLGLASVYGVVKQNNGYINVCSEAGIGTTFRIYLPRHLEATVQKRGKHPDEPLANGNETILVVEDEPGILKIVTLQLEWAGFTVLSAATPREAMQLARENVGKVHLLLSDVIMPEMNGRDLARNLLALDPGLKQLFMSGYTADIIASEGILDEGVNFIQKPFSTTELLDKVLEVLES